MIEQYGYHVEFVYQMSTSMVSSGEGHTVYFYRRASPLHFQPRKTECLLTLPKRSGFDAEEDVEVSCDPVFVDAIRRATLPLAEHSRQVDEFIAIRHEAGRPVRVRACRTFFE